MAKLWDISNGTIIPNENCYAIGYLRDIIDDYGKENSGKIFLYYEYMLSLDPDSPFSNVEKYKKKEIVIRAVCPEIDVDAPLIEEGFELCREIFETANYRAYESFSGMIDKLAEEIKYARIYVSKEEGNSGELEKAIRLYDTLCEKVQTSKAKMLEELNLSTARGGRKRTAWSGKAEDLE